MIFKIHKFSYFVFYLIITSVNLFNLNNNRELKEQMKKEHLRRIWEEEVPFKYEGTDTDEENSINKYCIKSGYKYFSHFVYGNKYIFTKTLIEGNAQPLIDWLNGDGDFNSYLRLRIDIGLFFFFVACAGVSIIVWVFNWVCWLNQCCCCDFLHNPVNKRIAWWISFSFLLGMLGCCISAFVSINRFGFALDGALCALDRIYYDFKNGELKNTNPKWPGFETEVLKTQFDELCKCDNSNKTISDLLNNFKGYFNLKEPRKGFDDLKEDEKFLYYCYHYGGILFGCMQVLAMIYFCLFLIAITFAGIAMMFYACLKRQGYLITIMHFLWNIIRFFMFSFFIFGAAYGIFNFVLKDTIKVVKYLFHENNLNLVPTAFFLGSDPEEYNFVKIYIKFEIKNLCSEDPNPNECSKDYYNVFISNYYKCETLDFFDCEFLENDLNMVYRALYDMSIESEILSALSLTSSFFGAIAVYFYLLVMHHYNNEIFFDSGKSIFRGFDGFGGGYKKKDRNLDPAYKKRKLRAEIELTSRNEDEIDYKNINKNEEDE